MPVRFDASRSLCAQTYPDSFFMEQDESAVERAKSICRKCPVMNDCLTEALNDPQMQGVWGATTTQERARLRRQGLKSA